MARGWQCLGRLLSCDPRRSRSFRRADPNAIRMKTQASASLRFARDSNDSLANLASEDPLSATKPFGHHMPCAHARRAHLRVPSCEPSAPSPNYFFEKSPSPPSIYTHTDRLRYVYTSKHIYISLSLSIHIHINSCVYMYMHTYIYVNLNVYIYIYVICTISHNVVYYSIVWNRPDQAEQSSVDQPGPLAAWPRLWGPGEGPQ